MQPTFDTNQAQSFAGDNLNQPQLTTFNGKPYVQAVIAGPVSANLGGGQGGGGGNCAAVSNVLNTRSPTSANRSR